MKLAINLPLLVYWQVLGEALSLCQPLALDPAKVSHISQTSGANTAESAGPLIAVSPVGKDTGGDFRSRPAPQGPAPDGRGGRRARLPASRDCTRPLCFDEASREIVQPGDDAPGEVAGEATQPGQA